MKAYRDRLAQKRLKTYKDYDTDLEILSQYIGDDGNLYVTAKETTMLTIAEIMLKQGIQLITLLCMNRMGMNGN